MQLESSAEPSLAVLILKGTKNDFFLKYELKIGQLGVF